VRIIRNGIGSMATGWVASKPGWQVVYAIALWAVALGHSNMIFAQLPGVAQFPQRTAPESQPGPLTSEDYLRLMEQANLAAGIQPVGGSFVGAKPRPRGSLEQPTQPMVSLPPETLVPEPARQGVPTTALAAPPFAPASAVTPPFAPASQLSPPLASASTASAPLAPESPVILGPVAGPQSNLPQSPLPQLTVPESPWQPLSQVPTSTPTASTKPWPGPRWVGRYAAVSVRRPGDESLTFSAGGPLGTFGSDLASEITVGYMTNPIDCYEFTYMGSLNWNRSLDSSGPVSSLLSSSDPTWLTHFQNADLHQQTHSALYRQYGLNRRWLTDDIGNSSIGLRVIDYSEQYRLRSSTSTGQGLYGLDTSNLLVGLASGMELWRPVSQRAALGGSIDGGLYANFAQASNQASDGNGRSASVDDQDLSLAASLTVHLRARYQLRSWAGLYGGYRWMVVSGLATVDDQAPEPLSNAMSLSTSSDATILLHGFDAGLELKF